MAWPRRSLLVTPTTTSTALKVRAGAIMHKVRIIAAGVPGHNINDEVDMPEPVALSYCRRGLAEPVGWRLAEPRNRMLDTRTAAQHGKVTKG